MNATVTRASLLPANGGFLTRHRRHCDVPAPRLVHRVTGVWAQKGFNLGQAPPVNIGCWGASGEELRLSCAGGGLGSKLRALQPRCGSPQASADPRSQTLKPPGRGNVPHKCPVLLGKGLFQCLVAVPVNLGLLNAGGAAVQLGSQLEPLAQPPRYLRSAVLPTCFT